MLSVVLAMLAATPVAPIKLAMPALRLTDIPIERAGFYTEQLAGELIAQKISVVTERDISTLLGLERQRELLGCADGVSECLMELANGLGVDAVVVGDLAKVGTRYQVNLRIIAATTGAALATESFKAADEEALVDGLVKAAQSLAIGVTRALGREVPVVASSGGIGRRMWWVPAVLAGVSVGVGAACLLISRDDYARLDPSTPGRLGLSEAEAIARNGSTLQTVAVVLFATAGAFAVGAVSVWLFGTRVEMSAAVTPTGAAFVLTGALP